LIKDIITYSGDSKETPDFGRFNAILPPVHSDLKAGDLASQISFMGRPGPGKELEIALIDPAGKRAGGYYITEGLDAKQEAARVLPIF
jgi:hypothetical protein